VQAQDEESSEESEFDLEFKIKGPNIN